MVTLFTWSRGLHRLPEVLVRGVTPNSITDTAAAASGAQSQSASASTSSPSQANGDFMNVVVSSFSVPLHNEYVYFLVNRFKELFSIVPLRHFCAILDVLCTLLLLCSLFLLISSLDWLWWLQRLRWHCTHNFARSSFATIHSRFGYWCDTTLVEYSWIYGICERQRFR